MTAGSCALMKGCLLLTALLLQGDASLQAAPLMFLYMLHPHKPLPAASHNLFCAVIRQTSQVFYSLATMPWID